MSSVDQNQLVIVLRLEEGIGFNNTLCDKIIFDATIQGNKLEHGPINTGHTTVLDSNLIWETDRKSIKRMKLENVPLKIDIYGIKASSKGIDSEREHIGYILIPIRAIPLLPLTKALQLKCRWQKLIGLCKNWRPYRPELLMNVMITESVFLDCDKSKLPEVSASADEINEMIVDENPNPCTMMTSNKGIFIRLLQKEGLLQVGNIDTNCDVFNVKILIKNMKYLNNIVVDKSASLSSLDQANQEFFISYILLGNNHSRKLDRKFNRTHQIQEKISINFRSSLRALQEYFEEIFYIPIEVYLDSKMIATTEIRLNKIIATIDLQECLKKYQSCFEYDGAIEIKCISPLNDAQQIPIMEYTIKVQYQATRKLHQLELVGNNKTQVVDQKAGGDAQPERLFASPTTKSTDFHDDKSKNSKRSTQSAPNMKEQEEVEIVTMSPNKVRPVISENMQELSHLFSYNMRIEHINFTKKPPKGIWQISFFHEKADTTRTYANREIQDDDINENSIILGNLELKLYFTSNLNEIMDVIKSSNSCTICIKGPYNTHAKANLDCGNLLIGNKGKIEGNILLTNQNDTVTAFAQITAFIKNEGFNFNSKTIEVQSQDKVQMEVQIDEHKKWLFDESIAYNMILELEEWKNTERNNFLGDLKRTEVEYLDKLKKDFDETRANYEETLLQKNQKLMKLTQTLEETQKSMEIRKLETFATEERVQLESIKNELETAYREKLMMIKEETKQLEQDLMGHLKMKDVQIKQLEASSSELKLENLEMREAIKRLKIQHEELQSNTVPKIELEIILDELVSLFQII